MIGEQHKRRRRGRCLGHVINLQIVAGRGSAAVEVDLGEPAVDFAGGDALLPCVGHPVDQAEKLVGAVSGERGKENHRSEIQKFQFASDDFFVISRKLGGIHSHIGLAVC